jgi:hypothetical protein
MVIIETFTEICIIIHRGEMGRGQRKKIERERERERERRGPKE